MKILTKTRQFFLASFNDFLLAIVRADPVSFFVRVYSIRSLHYNVESDTFKLAIKRTRTYNIDTDSVSLID